MIRVLAKFEKNYNSREAKEKPYTLTLEILEINNIPTENLLKRREGKIVVRKIEEMETYYTEYWRKIAIRVRSRAEAEEIVNDVIEQLIEIDRQWMDLFKEEEFEKEIIIEKGKAIYK